MIQLLNYLLNKQWILNIVMYFLSDEKREKIYIVKLRAELSFWGYDTSEMTDEEIKKGVYKIHGAVQQCGVTSKELAMVLKRLSYSVQNNIA